MWRVVRSVAAITLAASLIGEAPLAAAAEAVLMAHRITKRRSTGGRSARRAEAVALETPGIVNSQGAIGDAIVHFQRTVALQPTLAEAHLSLGQALQQEGRAEEARAALDQARALYQRKADAQASTFAVSVGNQKLKSGDVAAAIEQYREAIRLADDNPQAHYRLALALVRRGALAEAMREYEAARRLAPYLQPPPGLR